MHSCVNRISRHLDCSFMWISLLTKSDVVVWLYAVLAETHVTNVI